MPAALRQRDRPASLAVQVLHAEARVMHHRRLIGVRASRLGQTLRARLTHPAVLLLAGGLGFCAEPFTRPRSSVPDDMPPPGAAERGSFATTVLKLIGIVGSLAKAFPAFATGSSVEPGYPAREPAPQPGPVGEP